MVLAAAHVAPEVEPVVRAPVKVVMAVALLSSGRLRCVVVRKVNGKLETVEGNPNGRQCDAYLWVCDKAHPRFSLLQLHFLADGCREHLCLVQDTLAVTRESPYAPLCPLCE